MNLPRLGVLLSHVPRRNGLGPRSALATAYSGRVSFHGLPPTEEYTETVKYPAITKFESKQKEEEFKLSKMVKSLRTVEEKLFYLNKPKYYGWYSFMLSGNTVPYGAVDFIQSTTCTHVVSGLPPIYDTLEENATRLSAELAPKIQSYLLNDLEASVMEKDVPNDKIDRHESHARPRIQGSFTDSFRHESHRLRGLNRIIVNHLMKAEEGKHLRRSQIDHDSRNEAFWFKAGFDPDKALIKKKKGLLKAQKHHFYHINVNPKKPVISDDEIYEKIDRAMQYENTNPVQIRNAQAITPYVHFDDDLCHQRDSIPSVSYDPRTYGIPTKVQHGTNLPGFWTTSRHQFVNLQYISPINRFDTLASKVTDEYSDTEDKMLYKSILCSFGSLLPQACYLGFGPFNDPEFPLATQTIVTDGFTWKMAVFQLNKTALFSESQPKEESLNNICWHQPQMELLKVGEDGQKTTVDQEVLKEILKFYLMKPTETPKSTCDNLPNVRNNYNREYFYNSYNHMASKRERAKPKPEILAYQKLFMIDHPSVWFPRAGTRERPFFKMSRSSYQGKMHWHPEFKHLDYYRPAYQPVKFRLNKKDTHVKKVVAPIPPDSE